MPDYSQFLHVAEGRQIWWPLLTAIRFGAGYVPNPTDSTTLVASSNRVKSNERTLIAAVRETIDDISPPTIFERDGERFVAAEEFLVWLAKYILVTKSDMAFPADLARAVSNAERDARGGRQYVHLSDALEAYFEVDFADLPSALQAATIEALSPFSWDEFGPIRRRQQIHNSEVNHDPAREGEREFWWKYVVKKQELERDIAKWEGIAARTVTEQAEKDDRLRILFEEQAGLESKMGVIRDLLPSNQFEKGENEMAAGHTYIPYADAYRKLNKRHGAIPEEIAGWVFLGKKDGGLAAFRNANELDPPPRFQFAIVGNDDYLGQLMFSWYRADELEAFAAPVRYLTGAQLIDRWRSTPGIIVEPFICAKIAEDVLHDFHPGAGISYWSHPTKDSVHTKASALFRLSEVETIEHKELGSNSASLDSDRPMTQHRNDTLQLAANALVAKLKAGKRKAITKREIARLLAASDEWSDLTSGRIERLIRVEW